MEELLLSVSPTGTDCLGSLIDDIDTDTVLQMIADLDSPTSQRADVPPNANATPEKTPRRRRGRSAKSVQPTGPRKSKWRKYGQKKLMTPQPSQATTKPGVVRCYYKCTVANCERKKMVDYVDGMPVGVDYKQGHSAFCQVEDSECASVAVDSTLTVIDPILLGQQVHALRHIHRMENLLSMLHTLVFVELTLSKVGEAQVIAEVLPNPCLDATAWLGKSVQDVVLGMIVAPWETTTPVGTKFFRGIVSLPKNPAAYVLLKATEVDTNLDRVTVMIRQQDC